jgi:rubrerythrin
VKGVPSEGFDTAIRLSDLRSAHAGATLQNLLSALSAKIDACSRLKVFEYEAGSEGHIQCAAAFRSLAEAERQSFHTLLACLQQHLDEVSPVPADTAQGGQG